MNARQRLNFEFEIRKLLASNKYFESLTVPTRGTTAKSPVKEKICEY
jgi:hypothetical protein|tara:strand:+ start:139 stop:279 length:141 start_codon:yes stop_codon:yes gene_type:complete